MKHNMDNFARSKSKHNLCCVYDVCICKFSHLRVWLKQGIKLGVFAKGNDGGKVLHNCFKVYPYQEGKEKDPQFSLCQC